MTTRRKRGQVADPAARYDAAGSGRRMAGWNPPATGPNRAIAGLSKIRDRSRDSVRNDWAGESSVGHWVTNLVGVGITPRWESEEHTRIWTENIVPSADADGVLDVYGLQTLGTRAWISDGECFLRRRDRPLDGELVVPVQFQLLESDYCPVFDADSWPNLPVNHVIRQGIELDRRGRRRAYWFYREHPGDGFATGRPSPFQLVRVPANQVSHVYCPSRPGQLRGVSTLAAVLVRLRDTNDFEDTVLTRQKLANLFTMFITREIPEWSDALLDPNTGLPKVWNDKGNPLVGLEPGISQELIPGEKVQFANPPEAGAAYADYVRAANLGTAAGQHLPYEIMSGDIRDVSDRTLRVVINEFRRLAEQRQFQIVIPRLCQPTVTWGMEAAVLAGLLPPSELKAAQRPEWAPHGWAHIHPVQDVEGQIKARDAGLTSTVRLITQKGDDPRVIAKERKLDKTLGLVEPPPAPKPAAAPAPKPAAAPAPAPAPRAALELPEILAAVQAFQPQPQAPVDPSALVSALATAMTAAMAPLLQAIVAQASQRIEATVNVPAAQVDVHVPQAAAPVIENTVNVPAPNVTNVVNVEPAPVEVDVKLPDRETTSAITHDDDGRIVAVTQTERTVQ